MTHFLLDDSTYGLSTKIYGFVLYPKSPKCLIQNLPCSKCLIASSASNIPSNHGSNFLAQWSECTKTLEPLEPLEPLGPLGPLELGEPLGMLESLEISYHLER